MKTLLLAGLLITPLRIAEPIEKYTCEGLFNHEQIVDLVMLQGEVILLRENKRDVKVYTIRKHIDFLRGDKIIFGSIRKPNEFWKRGVNSGLKFMGTEYGCERVFTPEEKDEL
jgi:hypothetical protein